MTNQIGWKLGPEGRLVLNNETSQAWIRGDWRVQQGVILDADQLALHLQRRITILSANGMRLTEREPPR